MALIFTGYVLTFFVDLLPAVRTKHHPSPAPQIEMGHGSGGAHLVDGGDYQATTGEYGYPNGYTNGSGNGYARDAAAGGRYYGNGAATNGAKPVTARNF